MNMTIQIIIAIALVGILLVGVIFIAGKAVVHIVKLHSAVNMAVAENKALLRENKALRKELGRVKK